MAVAAPSRPRLTPAFVLCCLLALGCAWLAPFAATEARAQDAAAGGDEAAKAEAPKAPSSNMFVHMIKSVGFVMGFILGGLSIAMVALLVLLFMDLRMGDSVPPGFVEEFTDTVNKRRFKEAYELAKQDSSYLARVLTSGM